MGGCSSPNCSNSTTVGRQLFRFPKDPVRMRKWLVNCRRDFVATPCSRLCQPAVFNLHDVQDHFEESQFEEIARSPAGGRKLKPNAIPTQFDVTDPPSPVTPQTVLPVKNEPIKVISTEPPRGQGDGGKTSVFDFTMEKDLNMGDHGYARRQHPVDSEEDGDQRSDEEQPCSFYQHHKIKLEQHQQHTVRLQREAEEMKKRLYKLSKIEKGLQVYLFEDQIRALTLAKRSRRAVWSHGTLLTARKIRCTVGVKGYEYLRELGYPLPSYSAVYSPRAQNDGDHKYAGRTEQSWAWASLQLVTVQRAT